MKKHKNHTLKTGPTQQHRSSAITTTLHIAYLFGPMLYCINLFLDDQPGQTLHDSDPNIFTT